MSVREALLGILCIGPAYGLQLHSELGIRAPHRAGTNVGQVYGTLDRLVKAGLVEPAGNNSEGLPLYQLTTSGKNEAEQWLSGTQLSDVPTWDELLDMVLISRSIDARKATQLHNQLVNLIQTEQLSLTTLSEHAHARYIGAVNGWLSDVEPELSSGEMGYSTDRAKRGRPSKPRG